MCSVYVGVCVSVCVSKGKKVPVQVEIKLCDGGVVSRSLSLFLSLSLSLTSIYISIYIYICTV